MKKSKLKRFIKGCFSISVFSIAGCIALSAQAQNSYASQQILGPGGMQSQNIKQLLSEINGNILGLKKSSNSLLDVQKKATSTGVGDLFNHTTNIVPAAPIDSSSDHYNNSSYPQMNLNLDKSVSLSKLGDDIGANKDSDNYSHQGGGDYNKQPTFSNLVADTYCSKKLDDINHNTPSFISWALSAPNSISSQNNQPSLMSDPVCLNYIYKLKNNIYKDYTQNSYNNNFASAASANQTSNIDNAYYNAKNMIFSQDSLMVLVKVHLVLV